MPAVRSKSATSSRGRSSTRSGSTSRASSAASKGSKKGKAAQKLQNKVDRLHDNATEFIEKGDSKNGLKELAKLIRLHAQHQKKSQSTKKPSALAPAWQIAEEYALTANSEMVFRSAALDAQQDVQWLSREALRFVGGAAEEKAEGGSSKGSAASSRSSSASAKGKKSAPNYLAGQNTLKKALKAMVLNNQAVQRWIGEEPMNNVINLLQRALAVSEGVFCSLILYNLSVAFMAIGRFEDTTETIARCLEITNGYMQHVRPPSMKQLLDEEEAANRPKTVSKKRKGGKKGSPSGSKPASPGVAARRRASSASPAAKHSKKSPSGRSARAGKKSVPVVAPLTEGELAEIARQERLTELRRRWKIYSTFIVTMASHTILCHHVIATLSVWCDMEGLEKYHCELALGCAKKYLPLHHPMQKRCRDRLHNVTNGNLPRIKPHGGIPPQLPLITQADFIATPCAAASKLPLEESPFSSAVTASKMPPVRLSELLSFATTVAKPTELSEFMKAMAAEAKKAKQAAKKKSGKKARSRSASLPILNPGSREGSASKRKRRRTTDPKTLMLERLLPPLHEDPPVGLNGPQFVTKVPRIAYERYEHLKNTTIHYLATSGSILPERKLVPITPEASQEDPSEKVIKVVEPVNPLKVEKRRESMINSAATLTRANGAQVPPPELMFQYDTDLKRMSTLVKDFIPEIRFRGAQMIQRQWKFYAAHLELERRKRAVEEWLSKAEAASDIMYYYLRWKERLPAILKANELRRERTRAHHLTKIQAFLHQMQSIEEWGRKCAALYERLLAEKRERERRSAAATMIQSVWRMCAEKLQRGRDYSAAAKIQSQWRCRTARHVLMAKRVHKRLMYEQFLRSVEDKIVYIQRWYRACKARQAVAGLLERKKKEIEDYLCREEKWFDKEMGHLMDDPNLETKVRKIMSVLRGAKIRSELQLQWKSRNTIKEALTKFALRQRGGHQLHELREEKAARERLARRREEVKDAATQIQALVRQRQAHQLSIDLKECFRMMDDAARCIQRTYALHRRQVALSQLAERRQLQEEAKQMGKLRDFAALRIQALWRGMRERQEQSEFLEFMKNHRHRLAQRIQRAWKAYRSRSLADQRSQAAQESHRATALYRRKCVAATRIAAVFRMHRVRKAMADSGQVVRPTAYTLYHSARKIQCAWRRNASYHYVQQRRLALAFRDNEKASQEALHAYATQIQSLVRAKIINPIRVAMWRRALADDGDGSGGSDHLHAEVSDSDDKGNASSGGARSAEVPLHMSSSPQGDTTKDHPVKATLRVSVEEMGDRTKDQELSEKTDSTATSGRGSSGRKKYSQRRIRFMLPGDDELRATESVLE